MTRASIPISGVLTLCALNVVVGVATAASGESDKHDDDDDEKWAEVLTKCEGQEG